MLFRYYIFFHFRRIVHMSIRYDLLSVVLRPVILVYVHSSTELLIVYTGVQ